MSVPGLFEPKNQEKGLDDLLKWDERKKEMNTEGVLVVAHGSKVVVLENFSSDTVIVAERESHVMDFCLHDGVLYDCTVLDGITSTLSNDTIVKGPGICTIASHEGCLYYSDRESKIINVTTDELVAERDDEIWVLESFNNSLYDSGLKGMVWDTLDESIVAERYSPVFALHKHNGILYDGGDYDSIHATYSDSEFSQVYDYFPAVNLPVNSLFSFSKGFYMLDANSQVFNMFTKQLVYDYFDIDKIRVFPRSALRGVL